MCTYVLVFICTGLHELQGQTPSDAIMMPRHNACVLLSYDHSSFDEYWEGSYLRQNQTIETVTRKTVLPMIAIGILDQLDAYIGLPYVKTGSSTPNGGHFAGVSGLQDFNLALKYNAMTKELPGGILNLLGTVGYSTPASNYLSDYMPYSLGFGASQFNLRAIAQYRLNSGIYMRLAVGHMWRGYTKAERDYYYNNGSFYTPWMDVPNAVDINAVAGIWLMDNKLKLEVAYAGLRSTSGDDIRAYNPAQPTNKTEFDQLGLSAQYYFSQPQGPGILIYHNRILNGRNMPKLASYGIGLTYQFAYLNTPKLIDNE